MEKNTLKEETLKKVGICACYDSRNYGSMLQALATQIVIENMGYSSEYIVYRKKKNFVFILRQIPRLLNRNLMFDKMLVLRKKIALLRQPQIRQEEKKREQAFQRFKKEYYRHFSKPYYGYQALCENASNYQSVVVGSDQLWTPGGLATHFYDLTFVPDSVNKISYATSFGVTKIPGYQKRRTRDYLRRIQHLSVREVKGAEIVKTISGRDAKVVVDPTLLLTAREWENVIPAKSMVPEKYIFCYFLGENPEHRALAEELKEKTGLAIVTTPHLDCFVERDLSFGDYPLFEIGPNDFVNLIRHAEYVLTDSFHGTVFSILHHKPFITMNRFSEGGQSRNSRIDSLCQLLKLEERRYHGDIFTSIQQPIDYDKVETILEELREDSLDFLSHSLNC